MLEFSSVRQVCEGIFSLEDEHDLLDLEIGGVKVWQYLRMSIYYDIARKVGVLENPHPWRLTKWQKIQQAFSYLKSCLLHNPFLHCRPVDVLLVDHARSNMINGQWVDIYSHFFLQDLEAQGKNYLVLERPSVGRRLRQPSANRKHLDIIRFKLNLRRRLSRYRLSAAEEVKIGKISGALGLVFGVECDLKPKIAEAVFHFRVNYGLYMRLLKRLQPKVLCILVSYSQLGALIRAAKDLGIEVIEFQHGVFSRYHLGYSFLDRTEPLAYFPDKFLTWGRFWNGLIELPIQRNNVVDAGFPYFHYMRMLQSGIVRIKNRILVLSQGAIGRALAERILACADELKTFELVYKLHPSEYSCWSEYPALCKLARLDNVRVVDSSSDLYRLFAEAEYQIGVFSTAIYEGIGMGTKTVLIDLPGVEYMDELVSRGLAVLHKKGISMAACLHAARTIDTDSASREIFGTSKAGTSRK